MWGALLVAVHIDKVKCFFHSCFNDFFRNIIIAQSERNILLDYGGDELIVWILKNHADFAAQFARIPGIGCVKSGDRKAAAL